MQVRLSPEIADEVRARQEATGSSAATVVNAALWTAWFGHPDPVIDPVELPAARPAAPRSRILSWQ